MPRSCKICRHPQRDDIEADLRGGASYRDIARQHTVSKDALSRHRANHMSRHTATGLAAARGIMAFLDKAEASPSWNSTVLAVREARQYVQQLLALNLTVSSYARVYARKRRAALKAQKTAAPEPSEKTTSESDTPVM